MTPHDYCRSKVAAKGSALRYSLMFVDEPRRNAITAVYAFRDEVRSITREAVSIEPARAKLAWWRMEIAQLFRGRPHHPVTQALAIGMERFAIPAERLFAVVDGYETDLERSGYEDFEALKTYCGQVSGSVSLVVSGILGFLDARTEDFAWEIGLALQAISIIRDVGLDARLGRIYLPIEDLRRFNVDINDIFHYHHSHGFAALLELQTKRARNLYANALAMLSPEDRKAQRPALALAAIQSKLLEEIERDRFRVLDRRLFLPPLRKQWIAARTRFAN